MTTRHRQPVPPPPTKAPAKPVSPGQQSIFDFMKATLTSWGLGSLYNHALGYLKTGMSSAEVNLKLQDTKEWKVRFAGNEARVKAGLAALSPAEYLGLEQSYDQIRRQYGLPKGYYDSKAATDSWIGNDVSPAELSARASAAARVVHGDPNTLAAWNQFHGGGAGGAIAAILDAKTAAPLVENQVAAAEIGGSALAAGLTTSADRAMQIAKYGVGLDQARQAYSDIAARHEAMATSASRFGTTFGQADDEDATLLGDAKAKSKQTLINAEEAAQFSGHGGASSSSNSAGANY